MKYIIIPFIFYCILLFITYILFLNAKEDYQKYIPTIVTLTPELKQAIKNGNTTDEEMSRLVQKNSVIVGSGSV